MTPHSTDHLAALKNSLLIAYKEGKLWGEINPAWLLPSSLERGSEAHLAYLTLVYAISGGRNPISLWDKARLTFETDPQLFKPRFLAYEQPTSLAPRLRVHGLIQKTTSETTIWQRIGQALVMRAGGSVKKLLADHDYKAEQVLAMLAKSKTTFPVLSGPQTGPRWIYGLATVGAQSISSVEQLVVPVSPAAARALQALSSVEITKVSVKLFEPLDTLGRRGCTQRKPIQKKCPVAQACPVAGFCQFGR